MSRTPIAVEPVGEKCETPVRTMTLIDPRSPGCAVGGEVGVERTPILVMQKDQAGGAVSTPARGSAIPAFSLPETPCEDSPVSDSPFIIKSQALKTSTPTTVPLNYKTGQPSDFLQVSFSVFSQSTTSLLTAGKTETQDGSCPEGPGLSKLFPRRCWRLDH